MIGKKRFILVAVLAAVVLLLGLVGCVQKQSPPDEVVTLGTTNFDTVVLSQDLTVGDDLTVTDDTAVGGDLAVTGGTTLDNIVQTVDAYENVGGLPTIITTDITTAALTGTVTTIPDGEVWIIHSVFINVTTNFDCTGNDCTLTLGDGNDADGFMAAADAALQTTFTEATGYTAGWYGLENGSNGAYTVDEGLFLYAPSGADETIDFAIGGTDPAAGAATIYIVYTRVE